MSDIKMPGMDGTELLAEILKKNARTIMILMTAFGSIEAGSGGDQTRRGGLCFKTVSNGRCFASDQPRLKGEKFRAGGGEFGKRITPANGDAENCRQKRSNQATKTNYRTARTA
ncbi:MAG: hypothetical protein WKF90_01310 [Pyrinomonadaceae bacterium]